MPGPFTPISTIPSCPLSLIQFLNGVYYYEVGECPNKVTGYTTSMNPLTVGCDESNLCISPGPSLTSFVRASLRGGTSSELPRQSHKAVPRNAKDFAHYQKEDASFRHRTDIAPHRRVNEYGTARYWFEEALKTAMVDPKEWEAAIHELDMVIQDLSIPSFFQRDAHAQSLSAPKDPGHDVLALVPGKVKSTNRYATPLVKILAPAAGATGDEWRVIVLYETTLIDGTILYFGQEVDSSAFAEEELTAMSDAVVADRHTYCHVIKFQEKNFFITTYRELVARQPFI